MAVLAEQIWAGTGGNGTRLVNNITVEGIFLLIGPLEVSLMESLYSLELRTSEKVHPRHAGPPDDILPVRSGG